MFGKKKKTVTETYDKEKYKPMIKASICTGEQVAGFMELSTKQFKEECLIRNDDDLFEFKQKYGIEEKIEKFY